MLKTTLKDSIGLTWRVVRIACIIGILLSGWLYVNGMIECYTVLGLSTAGYLVCNGREYVITSLFRIRMITALRERLLTYSDNEFILQGIRDEQIWRGEEVDPEITKRLTEYERNREDLKNKLLELAQKFAGGMNVETTKAN